MHALKSIDGSVLVVGLILTALVLGVLVFIDQYVSRKLVKSRKLLTPNELEFLGRLRRALPQFEVLPQIGMSAVLDVTVPQTHPKYWAIRQLFALKTIDYVVVAKDTLDVVAIVELDDRTHDIKKDKDRARDQLLASAGLKTFRWDSRAKPTQAAIRAAFAGS